MGLPDDRRRLLPPRPCPAARMVARRRCDLACVRAAAACGALCPGQRRRRDPGPAGVREPRRPRRAAAARPGPARRVAPRWGRARAWPALAPLRARLPSRADGRQRLRPGPPGHGAQLRAGGPRPRGRRGNPRGGRRDPAVQGARVRRRDAAQRAGGRGGPRPLNGSGVDRRWALQHGWPDREPGEPAPRRAGDEPGARDRRREQAGPRGARRALV